MHCCVGGNVVFSGIGRERLGGGNVQGDHALALSLTDDFIYVEIVICENILVFNVKIAEQPDAACKNQHRENDHHEKSHHCNVHEERSDDQRACGDQYFFSEIRPGAAFLNELFCYIIHFDSLNF